MSISASLLQWGAGWAIDRPSRNTSFTTFDHRFQDSQNKILARLAITTPTPHNRAQLAHIIGIERWGQRRLQVALSQPPVSDEYDSYRPAGDRSWEDLMAVFVATRKETLRLIAQLEATPCLDSVRIPHNQFGELSIKGWLRYLDLHARTEIWKIR